MGHNAGDTFHAYPWLMDRPDLCGSYGYNRYTGGRATDHPAFRLYWFTSDIKRAGTIPVLSDSRLQGVMPTDADAPPESDGGLARMDEDIPGLLIARQGKEVTPMDHLPRPP